jgi:hypothetical protein
MRVEPGVVSLEPGGRTLVQIIATITDDLNVGAAYQGEVSVPGLSNTRVPLVLRRRESAQTPEPVKKAKTSRAKGKHRGRERDPSPRSAAQDDTGRITD